ncbi:hypothetical protein V8C42DRAFT_359100 [Trichoderma barbatum]
MSGPYDGDETPAEPPDFSSGPSDALSDAAQQTENAINAILQRNLHFPKCDGRAVSPNAIREALGELKPGFNLDYNEVIESVARTLKKAPSMKHIRWNQLQDDGVLLRFDRKSPLITILNALREGVADERKCWTRIAALSSASTLQSIEALDIEAILASVASLAGVCVLGSDPIDAVEEVHYGLSNDLTLLRKDHQRLKALSSEETEADGVATSLAKNIQEPLDLFIVTRTKIVARLFPGRLDGQMQVYFELLQYSLMSRTSLFLLREL